MNLATITGCAHEAHREDIPKGPGVVAGNLAPSVR